jgi:hypothetical protein
MALYKHQGCNALYFSILRAFFRITWLSGVIQRAEMWRLQLHVQVLPCPQDLPSPPLPSSPQPLFPQQRHKPWLMTQQTPPATPALLQQHQWQPLRQTSLQGSRLPLLQQHPLLQVMHYTLQKPLLWLLLPPCQRLHLRLQHHRHHQQQQQQLLQPHPTLFPAPPSP